MTKTEIYPIDKEISLEDLDALIKNEKNSRVLQRLYFIRLRYLGYSVENATSMLGASKKIGYIWQERWNNDGYEGLLQKSGAGRPPKLNEEQKEELKTILKEKDYWTTVEVRNLVKDRFNIEYSLNPIRRILKEFGMNYSKPYIRDYRRPENAEKILKKVRRSNSIDNSS